MTNIITSLADLQSVFLALMISDASDAASKMALPEQLPIQRTNLTIAHVNSADVIPYLGLGGVIDTPTWSYSYPKCGKLAFVVRKQPDLWKRNDVEEYRKFAVPASAIDTNRAYRIATRWLEGLRVDMDRLSRECTVSITNKKVRDVIVPEYRLVWSKNTRGVASVVFMEPGPELWQLRVEDPSFLLRPSITNGLAISLTK